MKAMFYVLNHTEKLDELLHELAKNDVLGATVLQSRGMAKVLSSRYDEDEFDFLFSVKQYLVNQTKNNNVIMMLIEDDRVAPVVEIIEGVVGELSRPDTGIVFTFPIDFVKGLRKHG